MEDLVPLTDTDRRLRLYLQTADVVLLLLDRDGRVREINRKGCDLLGYEERDLVGRDWFATAVPAAERAAARAAFDRRVAGEEDPLRRDETPVVTGSGAIRRIAWHTAVLRDARQEIVGTLSSGEDVTEQRATTELLERLAVGTASAVGGDFLARLTRELAAALDARCALVGALAADGEQLEVVASWPADDFLRSFALPLASSPLGPTVEGDLRVVPADAFRRFPSDPLLERFEAEAVLALALRASDGRRFGVLAVLYPRPLGEAPLAQAVVRLFGARAAAELERLRSEEALEAAKELAEVTLHSIGDAVITTDTAGAVTDLNPAAERLLGWPLAEARGLPLGAVLRLVHERTGAPLPDPAEQCFREAGPVALPSDTVLVSRDGRRHAVADTAAPIRDRDGNVVGSVLVFQDVTEARLLSRTLAWRAAHDELTGLLNRGELERRLEAALRDAAERGVQHVLCYLDLDQFKLVNDLCGHQAGDELLRRLARLLRQQCRDADVVARLGGDEFALLLDGCPLPRARRLAESICRAVRGTRFTWDGRVFQLGASIGVVPVNAAAESSAWLLARADSACYAAKDLGRNRVFVAEDGDPALVRRQLEMSHLAELLGGLEQGRFQLFLQPIVPLAGGDGGIHGEVLLRWRDEAGRQVSPAAFIPAAERYNMMPTVDTWVLREALRFFGDRVRRFDDVDFVALNLSSNTVSDEGFGDRVREVLAETGFPARRLLFEITETSAVENLGQAVALIERLRSLGCRFALDDFGSGLSSFSLLRSLPLDLLKIDGTFVRNMNRDPVDRAVVESTTRVAHAMAVATIAEWVDTADLLPGLRELGIDYAQGFAVGGPVPLSQLS